MTEPYRTCRECGGECCKGFAVPLVFEPHIHTVGVPIAVYESKHDLNPKRYFTLHTGITISGDGRRFIVSDTIKTKHIVTHDGIKVFVESRCTRLGKDGQCIIYKDRPDMCKNFTRETLADYIVPECCKYLRAAE